MFAFGAVSYGDPVAIPATWISWPVFSVWKVDSVSFCGVITYHVLAHLRREITRLLVIGVLSFASKLLMLMENAWIKATDIDASTCFKDIQAFIKVPSASTLYFVLTFGHLNQNYDSVNPSRFHLSYSVEFG
jgi:hypothetical protein